MIYKTQEELDVALSLWVKRLGLSDWQIKAVLRTRDQMEATDGGVPTIGWNDMNRAGKQSFIRVLRHEDYYDVIWPCDHQSLLVHELCHILVWAWPIGGSEGIDHYLQEQAVDNLTRLFLKAWEGR